MRWKVVLKLQSRIQHLHRRSVERGHRINSLRYFPGWAWLYMSRTEIWVRDIEWRWYTLVHFQSNTLALDTTVANKHGIIIWFCEVRKRNTFSESVSVRCKLLNENESIRYMWPDVIYYTGHRDWCKLQCMTVTKQHTCIDLYLKWTVI